MPAIEKEIAYRLKTSINGNQNLEENKVFRENLLSDLHRSRFIITDYLTKSHR